MTIPFENHSRTRRPFCRACIRKDRVILNRWTPRLVRGGPAAMQLRTIRASLVDLYVIEGEGDGDGNELIVEPVAQSRLGKKETGTLLAWATRVGYQRVWLPSNVIDLEPQLAGGSASVRCRACGARWEDGSPNFWLHVREEGHFPGMCPVCGDSLPEWQVDSSLEVFDEVQTELEVGR